VDATVPSAELDERVGLLFASDPQTLADPYPLYRALREHSPVRSVGQIVVLARYADVKAALRDVERLSACTYLGSRAEEARARMTEEERAAFDVVAAFDASTVSHSDGEQHDRLRRIAHRAFTPRRIAETRVSVQRSMDELLDRLGGGGVSDLKDVAYQLPLIAIADMLGVPPADRDLIHGWSEAIGRSRGIVAADRFLAAKEAIDEFGHYVDAMVVDLRRSPREGSLIAALIDAEEAERLTNEELTTMFVFLLFAGHETTTNLIANGLLELLQRPDQWQALCAHPAGVAPAAVEELLRFVSPVQTINRIAVADFELGDGRIRSGQSVIGLLGSANRDPEVFELPDELDLARPPGPGHLDFGFGTHFCLGVALARLEGEIAFATLASRFPELELAADPAQLRWGGNAMLRTLDRLPVRLTP
jgi:cytochrome P450